MKSDFDGVSLEVHVKPILPPRREALEWVALVQLDAIHLRHWESSHKYADRLDRLRKWRAKAKYDYPVNHADAFPPIKLPPLDLTAAIPRVKLSA